MRIRNETKWRTDQLRTIISRVARDEAEPETRKRLRIVVKYHRYPATMGSSGNAFVGSRAYPGLVHIFVSRHGIDQVDFAHVAAHEIAHARGMKFVHGSARYERVGDYRERYAWAATLPIEERAPRPKPSPEIVTARKRAQIAAKVKAWQTRVKRANTMLKKWERKLRALDRRAEAAA